MATKATIDRHLIQRILSSLSPISMANGDDHFSSMNGKNCKNGISDDNFEGFLINIKEYFEQLFFVTCISDYRQNEKANAFDKQQFELK